MIMRYSSSQKRLPYDLLCRKRVQSFLHGTKGDDPQSCYTKTQVDHPVNPVLSPLSFHVSALGKHNVHNWRGCLLGPCYKLWQVEASCRAWHQSAKDFSGWDAVGASMRPNAGSYEPLRPRFTRSPSFSFRLIRTTCLLLRKRS